MIRKYWTIAVMLAVIGLFLLAAGSLVAQAQPPGKPKPGAGRFGGPGGMPTVEQVFQHLDRNGDGKLTSDEIPERMAERMKKADTDNDGVLTKAELEEGRKKLAEGQGRPGGGAGMPTVEEMFQRRDANGDGKLTKDELPESFAERLLRGDADGDGAVSKDELTDLRKKFADAAGPGGPFDPQQMFQRADKNGDGKLSKDELPPALAERLLRADKDGDGAVTKEELAEARKHFPGRRGESQPKE